MRKSHVFVWLALVLGAAPAAAEPGVDRLGDPLPSGAVARLGTTRFRAPQQIAAFAYSPDGKQLLAAAGGDVSVLDAETGKLLQTFSPGDRAGGPTRGLAFTADGKQFVTADFQGTVRVWEDGKVVRSFKTAVPVNGLAVSKDLIATWGGRPEVRLFSLEGKSLPSLPLQSGAGANPGVALAPDGRLLAVGGQDCAVNLFDVADGKSVRKLGAGPNTQPTAPSRLVAWSPDGKLLLAGSAWTPLILFKAETGETVHQLTEAGKTTLAFTFSPTGKFVAAVVNDDTLRVWGVASGEELRRFPIRAGLSRLAFRPDGKILAGVAQDAAVRIWDLDAGTEGKPNEGHRAAVASLAFFPDGKRLVAHSVDAQTYVWGGDGLVLDRPEMLYFFAGPPVIEGDDTVVAPDNGQPAVVRWTVGGKRTTVALEVPKLPPQVSTRAISGDGEAIALSSQDGSVRVWDTRTGQLRQTLQGEPGGVSEMAFTFDHRLLAVPQGDNLTLWDVAGGKTVRKLPKFGSIRVQFAPDGMTFLGFRQGLTVWETWTGRERLRWDVKLPLGVITFSPDGRTVAVGGSDGTIHVHDLFDGHELIKLEGHRGAVRSLAYSRDGSLLASGGADTTVLLWDATRWPRGGPAAPVDSAIPRLWEELAGTDAAQAHKAIWALAAAPQRSVPWLKGKLAPVPRESAERIARLVADLDSDDFATRRSANQELESIGRAAEPALLKAQNGDGSLEMKKRVQALLEKLASDELPPERLRHLRAVEVLRQAATTEARAVLQGLADGADGELLTREAKAALKRLSSQP
jgi:WD40 repeat protein